MYTRPSEPRTVGGVFGEMIRLYKASARGWWLASVLAASLDLIVSLYVERSFGTEPTLDALLLMLHSSAVWRASLFAMLGSLYLYCVMIRTINATYLGGEPAPADGFGASLRLLPSAVLAAIIALLALVAGMILLVIPGVWLFGRLQFWPVALIAEGGGAGDALRRSSRLVRGHWWHASTVVTIALLLVAALGAVLDLVILAVAAAAGLDGSTTLTLSEMVSAVLKACFVPLLLAAYVASYHELGLRHERAGAATSG